jgi:hypothetical protein
VQKQQPKPAQHFSPSVLCSESEIYSSELPTLPISRILFLMPKEIVEGMTHRPRRLSRNGFHRPEKLLNSLSQPKFGICFFQMITCPKAKLGYRRRQKRFRTWILALATLGLLISLLFRLAPGANDLISGPPNPMHLMAALMARNLRIRSKTLRSWSSGKTIHARNLSRQGVLRATVFMLFCGTQRIPRHYARLSMPTPAPAPNHRKRSR